MISRWESGLVCLRSTAAMFALTLFFAFFAIFAVKPSLHCPAVLPSIRCAFPDSQNQTSVGVAHSQNEKTTRTDEGSRGLFNLLIYELPCITEHVSDNRPK